MSRPKPKVKYYGAVDLHFHGAFGIDLMRASVSDCHALSKRLLKRRVAAFCPTTLSASKSDLLKTVRTLGTYVREAHAEEKRKGYPGALPLGLHLEGPFIHPMTCGAHPQKVLRKATLPELSSLWEASQHTLKILTMAPEIHSARDLREIARFCKRREIVLSLGHSDATESQALEAFKLGFTNVTHLWNAMPFKPRAPGVVGAALGHPHVFIELIIDQAHVDPSVLRFTEQLHPCDQTCYVSDATPAACLKSSQIATFGPLKVRNRDGASRLKDGSLAGGGKLLPEMFIEWCKIQSRDLDVPLPSLIEHGLSHIVDAPLSSLGMSSSALGNRKCEW